MDLESELEMKLYLNTTVEDKLEALTEPDSPFTIETKFPSYSFLKAKSQVFSTTFLYTTPDEENSGVPMHLIAQELVGFIPKSLLPYSEFNSSEEEILAFNNIMKYVAKKDISFYLIRQDKYGEEQLLGYYNKAKKLIIDVTPIKTLSE